MALTDILRDSRMDDKALPLAAYALALRGFAARLVIEHDSVLRRQCP